MVLYNNGTDLINLEDTAFWNRSQNDCMRNSVTLSHPPINWLNWNTDISKTGVKRLSMIDLVCRDSLCKFNILMVRWLATV